jgi:Tfp pilus assembly protein PilV
MKRRRRAGFTLIETIVALVLLQVAMLALAATAGLAARDLTDSLTRRRAFAIANSRANWLRASACSSAESGTRPVAPGMTEHWRVESFGRARSVTDSISASLTRGRRAAVVARTWVLCGA